MSEELPDLYDPDEPLTSKARRPIYYIDGVGGFAAVDGYVRRTTLRSSHLEGQRVRTVLRLALDNQQRVRRVQPNHTDWHDVTEVPGG